MGIPLVKDTISKQDIDTLREWLGTYPQLTKGEETVKFEKRFSEYIGCGDSVFVNSGSSAILLMLQTLLEVRAITPTDGVVVPALSWSTDLAPVVQLGLEPILCDCNLTDLSVDTDQLERIFQTRKPRVLILVSVLGLVPDMDTIVKLCNEYHVILLEDVCESLGSENNGRKLGSYGVISAFSFYYGHHISTIEGGMVCTSNAWYADVLRSLRSHGWLRDSPMALPVYDTTPEFNQPFTFYYNGFNLRSTDLQAFIGLLQMDKLKNIVSNRNRIFHEMASKSPYPPYGIKRDRHVYISAMAFPVIYELQLYRNKAVERLKMAGVEYRPIICGNLAQQPVYIKKYGEWKYPKAQEVYDCGIYLPIYPDMTQEEVDLITSLL